MIFEDEDDLGYWTGAPIQRGPSALEVCNSIITMQERADLEAAAINAHEGHHRDAEKCRKFAGYDKRARRADRPARPIRFL